MHTPAARARGNACASRTRSMQGLGQHIGGGRVPAPQLRVHRHAPEHDRARQLPRAVAAVTTAAAGGGQVDGKRARAALAQREHSGQRQPPLREHGARARNAAAAHDRKPDALAHELAQSAAHAQRL